MNANALQQAIPTRPLWRMPISPERYDRRPLSDAERLALAVLVNSDAPLNSPARKRPEATLVRLIRPLHEIYGLRRVDATTRPLATRVMFGPDASPWQGVLAVVGTGVVRRNGCDGRVLRGRQWASTDAQRTPPAFARRGLPAVWLRAVRPDVDGHRFLPDGAGRVRRRRAR